MSSKQRMPDLYVSFTDGIPDSTVCDVSYIREQVKRIFPDAEEMVTHVTIGEISGNDDGEMVFRLPRPQNNDYLENRSFMVKVKSLLIVCREYSPHFTTYEMQ